MKESLLISILLILFLESFGQDSTKSISYYPYHALNIGVGVGWLNNQLINEAKPLSFIGYDYRRSYFIKRDIRLQIQVGLRFTNVSSETSFLDEELNFISIPSSIFYTKQYNAALKFNLLIGTDISAFINKINVKTDYFINYNIGSGLIICDRFELDFRYNFFVNRLEYISINNENISFTNNNFIVSFRYLFNYKKNKKQPYW